MIQDEFYTEYPFMKEYGYRRSQSALKRFESPDGCSLNWKNIYLTKELEYPVSESMLYGQFFETLVIGAPAYGEPVTDLPRLRSGAKSTDQQRIEEQAEQTKRLFNPDDKEYVGVQIKDVQFQLHLPDTNDSGVIDIVGIRDDGQIVLIDLKLVGDLTSEFGYYNYGKHDEADYTQQIYYEYIYEKQTGIKPASSAVIICDYKPALNRKAIKVNTSDDAKRNVLYRFSEMEYAIDVYEKKGWPHKSSHVNCSKCLLDCPFRYEKPLFEFAEVII